MAGRRLAMDPPSLEAPLRVCDSVRCCLSNDGILVQMETINLTSSNDCLLYVCFVFIYKPFRISIIEGIGMMFIVSFRGLSNEH